MSKIITIVNRKGGCGKTTTTKNLGYSLVKAGKRVLLVDLDPQCNLTKGLSKRNFKKTVVDVLESKNINRCIYDTRYELKIIPGNSFLASHDIQDKVISTQLESIRKDFDYILIDTSPYFNKLTAEILFATDLAIIPTTIEPDSLDGMTTTINELEVLCDYNINYKVLFTQVNNLKSTKKDLEELSNVFDDMVFDTKISYHRYAVKRARIKQQPLLKSYKRANVTNDYLKLANEIIMEVK